MKTRKVVLALSLLVGVTQLCAMNHNLAWPWGNPARCSNPQTPLFAFYNRENTTMMFDSGDEIAIYCQAAVRTGSGLTWKLSRCQVAEPFMSGEAEDLPANLFVVRIPTKDLTPGFYDLRVKLEGLGSAKLDLFPRKGRNGEVTVQSVPPTGICTFGWKADEMPVAEYRPADFVQFWRKAYADYRANVPLDARVDSAETTFDAKAVEEYNVTNACLPYCFDPKGVKHDEVVSYKVSWAGPDGGRVSAWLARPKAPGRYPAMLVLPGAGTNPRPRPLDHARHGYVAADVHVHGRDCENPDRGRTEGYAENGEPIRFPLEKVGWYNVYLRAARGVDYLASLPFVDAERIVTVGGSQGGRLSIVVPALEPRVAATVPSIAHGGNVPYLEWFQRMNGNVFKEGRPNYWGYYPDETLRKRDGRDLVGAPPVAEGEMMRSEAYFDIMNFAPEVKCPVLMSMGLVDYISFAPGVYATYLRCASPDKTIVPVAGHGHDWFSAFDRMAYRWLDKKLEIPQVHGK